MNVMEAIFEGFAADGNAAKLVAGLSEIAKSQGISEEICIEKEELERLEIINSIMKAMGYRLVPEKIDMA
jgi:DNA-binding phage protein